MHHMCQNLCCVCKGTSQHIACHLTCPFHWWQNWTLRSRAAQLYCHRQEGTQEGGAFLCRKLASLARVPLPRPTFLVRVRSSSKEKNTPWHLLSTYYLWGIAVSSLFLFFNPHKTHRCLPEVGINLQRRRQQAASVPYHVTVNGWGTSQRCRELAWGLLALPPRMTKRLPPLADAELKVSSGKWRLQPPQAQNLPAPWSWNSQPPELWEFLFIINHPVSGMQKWTKMQGSYDMWLSGHSGQQSAYMWSRYCIHSTYEHYRNSVSALTEQ